MVHGFCSNSNLRNGDVYFYAFCNPDTSRLEVNWSVLGHNHVDDAFRTLNENVFRTFEEAEESIETRGVNDHVDFLTLQ